MSALAMAMYLTGAGAAAAPEPKPVMTAPMPPPLPYRLAPPVPPPPPSRFAPPQRTQANLSTYFSTDDYPAAALRGLEQGTTGFRLSIGADGRVFNCVVTRSSGSAALDAATCRILRSRARYRPARDTVGNPMTGSDSGRVTWRLPEEDPHDRAGIPIPRRWQRCARPSNPMSRRAIIPRRRCAPARRASPGSMSSSA